MSKNKDGWFFKKNIIDEINSVPEELLSMEEDLASEVDIPKHNLKETEHLGKFSLPEEQISESQETQDRQGVAQEEPLDEKSILNADLSARGKEEEKIQEIDQSEKYQQLIQIQYLLDMNKELESQVAELAATIQQLEEEKQKDYEENEIILNKLQETEAAHTQEIKKNELLEESLHLLEEQKATIQSNLTACEQEAVALQEKNMELQNTFDVQSLEMNEVKTRLEEFEKSVENNRKEMEYSQREIGEVLLIAKKQASRTLKEAQNEADHLIKSARLELESMSNKARKILIEVDESKETVTAMYSDLQEEVRQLATRNMRVDFEAFEKQY